MRIALCSLDFAHSSVFLRNISSGARITNKSHHRPWLLRCCFTFTGVTDAVHAVLQPLSPTGKERLLRQRRNAAHRPGGAQRQPLSEQAAEFLRVSELSGARLTPEQH